MRSEGAVRAIGSPLAVHNGNRYFRLWLKEGRMKSGFVVIEKGILTTGVNGTDYRRRKSFGLSVKVLDEIIDALTRLRERAHLQMTEEGGSE